MTSSLDKMEYIERRWTQLLLQWINRCVATRKVTQLNPKSLAEVMAKYSKDICVNDFERAMLSTDDVEPFIKHKYPILRQRYPSEESDASKRLYIMSSLVLYHCCMSSKTGAVDEDIYKKLTPYEQELILKFCEVMCALEATVHNVERAIRDAIESVGITNDDERQSNLHRSSIWSESIPGSSCVSTVKDSNTTLPSDDTRSLNAPILNFNSSITVMPSIIADTSSYSELMTKSDTTHNMLPENYMYLDTGNLGAHSLGNTDTTNSQALDDVLQGELYVTKKHADPKHRTTAQKGDMSPDKENNVLRNYSEKDQNRWSSYDSSTGKSSDYTDPTCSKDKAYVEKNTIRRIQESFSVLKSSQNFKKYAVAVGIVLLVIGIVVCTIPFMGSDKNMKLHSLKQKAQKLIEFRDVWQCKNGLCEKTNQHIINSFTSYSRCSLICMGPQLWPYPTGYTLYSKKVITLATRKLDDVIQSVPSEAVGQYLNEAVQLFLRDLASLEVITDGHSYDSNTLPELNMFVNIHVESDPEPRLRLNTEEAYHLKMYTLDDQVMVNLSSSSFCGVRHGLETLRQMIQLDQSTGKLITLSNAEVNDTPSYRYRGLMVDTARNYISVPDLMRTIDAMATVKLNTFHWRISDVTSFPLLLPELPQLFEYGAYDRAMVYTKEDVRTLVYRAGIRGIRVLIEVAAPGPVGRPWSWSPDATCPVYNENYTCANVLCLRLNMKHSIFDTLRTIYAEILEITKVDDIFHLSDGIFSLSNCLYLIEDREGFLDKALTILTLANKGFMVKLPVIWYTPHLMKEYEGKTWNGLGVQMNEVKQDAGDNCLSKFKVIHSAKWDLSCEMKMHRCMKYRTWQEMYTWRSWRGVDVLANVGGEAVLWTDLVNSANLDSHIWPRAAAVAERLWSDDVINGTATSSVYVRLDTQRYRWRMLFHGINVQPVWPLWCSLHPAVCLEKINSHR